MLRKLLERNNQGVVYLTNEDIQNRIVESFVDEVREKYMPRKAEEKGVPESFTLFSS